MKTTSFGARRFIAAFCREMLLGCSHAAHAKSGDKSPHSKYLCLSIVVVLAWASTLSAQNPPASPVEQLGRGGSATRLFSEMQSRRDAVPKVDVPQPVFPKRQLKFDVSEAVENREMSMETFDSLRENIYENWRYEATFVLCGVPAPFHFSDPMTRLEQAYVRTVNRWQLGEGPFSSRYEILSAVPKEMLPAPDIVKWFEVGRGFHIWSNGPSGGMGRMQTPGQAVEYQMTIYAPTADRAKQLSEALLTIYDNGVFAPLLKADETLKRQHHILLEENRKALADAEKAIAQLQKELDELKEYQDLSKEVLTNLTTQLWQITVERAGIEARVRACEKLLAKKNQTYDVAPGTSKYVNPEDTIKIKSAAEIDLAGLVARQAAVKELVAKGRQRSDLADALSQVRTKNRFGPQGIEQEEKAVAFYEDQLKRYQPFPVVDNKVTIRPIKWELTKSKK